MPRCESPWSSCTPIPHAAGPKRYTIDPGQCAGREGASSHPDRNDFAAAPPPGVPPIRRAQLHAPGFTRWANIGIFSMPSTKHLRITPYDIVHAMLPVRHCDVYHPHAGVPPNRPPRCSIP